LDISIFGNAVVAFNFTNADVIKYESIESNDYL